MRTITITVALLSTVSAGYAPQQYSQPQQQQYQAPQQPIYHPVYQQGNAPSGGGYAVQGQGPQVLTGYLLTPVEAPPAYVNNPAEIPPMAEGTFGRLGGGDDHPLYVIQNPDTSGSAPFLPPGYSSNPNTPDQKPNGFFMPVGNAPIQDGREFTLMVVNGLRTNGPAYNALPVQQQIESNGGNSQQIESNGGGYHSL